MIKKLVLFINLVIAFSLFTNAQRSIGRQYSPKLMEQEKYFDNLKKANGENYSNKEYTIEIPVQPNTEINIENTHRTIEIRTWSEPKVKMIANVYFEGPATKLNADTWFDKLKISSKFFGNILKLRSEALYNNVSNNSGVAVYSIDGEYIKTETSKNKTLIIFVPEFNTLKLDSKYADVAITNSIDKLNATVSNGYIQIQKANKCNLNSKYGNAYIEQINTGEIDFINGNLDIKQAGDIELVTKYSTVNIEKANKLISNSTNDDVDIEEVNYLEAAKEYGSFKINNLYKALQLDGTNADVKIKNINASITNIQINNKYAQIKMPLKQVNNFNFSFDGTYSTIYKSMNWAIDGSEEGRINTGDAQNSKYRCIAGTGNDTKIIIRCQNCTVDCR